MTPTQSLRYESELKLRLDWSASTELCVPGKPSRTPHSCPLFYRRWFSSSLSQSGQRRAPPLSTLSHHSHRGSQLVQLMHRRRLRSKCCKPLSRKLMTQRSEQL